VQLLLLGPFNKSLRLFSWRFCEQWACTITPLFIRSRGQPTKSKSVCHSFWFNTSPSIKINIVLYIYIYIYIYTHLKENIYNFLSFDYSARSYNHKKTGNPLRKSRQNRPQNQVCSRPATTDRRFTEISYSPVSAKPLDLFSRHQSRNSWNPELFPSLYWRTIPSLSQTRIFSPSFSRFYSSLSGQSRADRSLRSSVL